MTSAMHPVSGTLPAVPLCILCSGIIIISAATIIVVAMVAARLIRDITQLAIAKVDPEDIPDMLTALASLLSQFGGLLRLQNFSNHGDR